MRRHTIPCVVALVLLWAAAATAQKIDRFPTITQYDWRYRLLREINDSGLFGNVLPMYDYIGTGYVKRPTRYEMAVQTLRVLAKIDRSIPKFSHRLKVVRGTEIPVRIQRDVIRLHEAYRWEIRSVGGY